MYVFYMFLNIEQKYNSYDFPGVGKNVSDLLFYKKKIVLLISVCIQWQENETFLSSECVHGDDKKNIQRQNEQNDL